MVAVYVGYKVAGVAGAVVGAIEVFLLSFILLLSVLPVLDRVRALRWAHAAMQGIGPAVIGVLTASLGHMAPHALPDLYAAAMLVATVMAFLVWRTDSFKLMLAGAVIGVLRSRLLSLPGMQATLFYDLGGSV
jgi:chromate transporter